MGIFQFAMWNSQRVSIGAVKDLCFQHQVRKIVHDFGCQYGAIPQQYPLVNVYIAIENGHL